MRISDWSSDVCSSDLTLAVLACLVLELRHAIEPTHARGAIQKPGKFSMGGHTGLIKKDGTIRIDPGGNKCGGHFPDVADALLTRFMPGDVVPIDRKSTRLNSRH